MITEREYEEAKTVMGLTVNLGIVVETEEGLSSQNREYILEAIDGLTNIFYSRYVNGRDLYGPDDVFFHEG